MTNRLYAMTVTKLADDDFLFECPVSGIAITGTETTLEKAISAANEALYFTLAEDEHHLPASITPTQLDQLRKHLTPDTYCHLIPLTSADIKSTQKEISY